MADKSSDRTLMALLGLETDTLPAQGASAAQQGAVGELRLPSLDERVEMFLYAVFGSERSFTAQEKAWARDRILTAMAADIADNVMGAADNVSMRASAVAVPLVSATPLAAARSQARPWQTFGNMARGVLHAALLPLGAFSIRSLRVAAIPLVAVLAVVTVWGGMSIDFAPNPDVENARPDLPASSAPPNVSQRTTRSLGPTQPEVRSGPALDARSAHNSEEALRREIASAESALGPNHPDVAEMAAALANLYQSQQRYGEAEALYNRALTIRERALGRNHPEVAQTLNQLAGLYRAQGRTSEADELSRRASSILEGAHRVRN